MPYPVRSSAPQHAGLYLRAIGGVPRVVALQEGVSIGRDPNNTIVIDHPDVRPIHATVWRLDDAFLLECAASNVVVLGDGSEASRLMLINGARCRIGDAVLTCTENASIDADDRDLACARCGHDLTKLPAARRYCPRCGLDLSVRAVPVVDFHPPAVERPGTLPPREPSSSVIVVGYATAMNKLGARYEVGQGVHRNEDEAVRCFGKAARLGNEDAKTRLERWGQA